MQPTDCGNFDPPIADFAIRKGAWLSAGRPMKHPLRGMPFPLGFLFPLHHGERNLFAVAVDLFHQNRYGVVHAVLKAISSKYTKRIFL